jgi:hypothetical protein
MRFTPFAFTGAYRTASLVTDGLVFDFKAEDYQSGSLTWNSTVGNYTASVTGTTSGGLEIISASTYNAVGFDGTKFLQFDNATSASISSSQWEVYSYVSFTNAQTASTSFTPEFFSKGGGLAPAWNYAYKGGTASDAGFGQMAGGFPTGYTTDTLNAALSGYTTQLFAMTHTSQSATPGAIPSYITVNWYNNVVGNTILNDSADYIVSFTGSAVDPLLFGKAVNAPEPAASISGSVIRLFAYNRILTARERKDNWYTLTGTYIK